ncbi:hypothetical protein B0H65DRAFT_570701 [Neurospora tetraspora]|uniref:Uncharacterized protein n=1 Tax=Neurospora tetraspora TaxID=94610 RepID=A0AAE0MTA9_9PEZI|nr:hypothetical protein B0H65DRAFT_570701 [Neurospora tetraspora]
MVRVKISTKPPPHWKVHSPAARKRQQTKKGQQSKVDNDVRDDESWLLLPEPAADAMNLEVDKPTKVVIPTSLPASRLHAAMEMIPVEDIVGRMYHLGCPPSNKELVADATVFVEEAAKLEATGEIKEAAITILEDLAFTINDRGTGAYPVGQQYEFLKKQVTFLGAIIQLIERPPKPVTVEPATAKPVPKRVSQLRPDIPKTDRVLRSRAAK